MSAISPLPRGAEFYGLRVRPVTSLSIQAVQALKRALGDIGSYFSVFGEVWQFIWARKLWWLAPIVLCLLVLGALLALASATPASPFLYTLF